MDQLRAITTFIRAAQSGSISEAARTLGLTPQAASKHILNLEQWAGVRLLNRTTHKISLTEEGLAFYERCKPAVESIEEGLIALRDVAKDPLGTVRLAVPHGIVRLADPLMGRFPEQYPRVCVGSDARPFLRKTVCSRTSCMKNSNGILTCSRLS
jgi:DNA-binding transcriptional LysR family regulator